MNKSLIVLFAIGLVASGSLLYVNNLETENETSGTDGFSTFSSEEEFQAYLGGSGGDTATRFESLNSATVERSFSDGLEAADSVSGDASSGSVERVSETNKQFSSVGEPDILKNTGERMFYSPEERFNYFRQENSESGTYVFDPLPVEEFNGSEELPSGGEMFLTNDSVISLGDSIESFSQDSYESEWSKDLNSSIESARKIDGEIFLVLKEGGFDSSDCVVNPLEDVSIGCTDFYRSDTDEGGVTYSFVKMDADSGEILEENGFVGRSSNTVTFVTQDSIYLTNSDRVSRTNILMDFLDSEGGEYVDQKTLDRVEELDSYNISDASLRRELEETLESYFSGNTEGVSRNELENALSNYTVERKRELSQTKIAKFDTEDLELEEEGEVPGVVNDRYSLGDSEDGLRIATTVAQSRLNSVEPENDLYTLNQELEIAGSVKGMGLNEQIYSVRYIDDKAYVVTFRRVDPFHVIDLSSHESPELKGELKLPGFSSYLHPLQEDQVLGIGEEDGQVKAVIFDVENDDPEVMDSMILDDYYSEIGDNPRAFQIDRENQVFFLPGSSGGHFFNYTDGLEQIKSVEMENVKRGGFVNQNFYVFSDTEAAVVNMENWETEKKVQFRENDDYGPIVRPEPMPMR